MLAVVFLVPVGIAVAAKTPAPPAVTGITVTSPNGGEVYTVGNKITITWKAASSISTVNLGYSSGPGNLNWIATSVPNTGSYTWTVNVGNTTNTKFLIDISGYSTVRNKSTYYHDQSNNYFTVNPAPAPTLSLTADNANIFVGGSTILRWTSTNATSCTASGAWSGSKALNGSYNTGAVTKTQGYYLSCSGLGGTIQKGVVIYVTVPPPTITLSADSTSVAYAGSTTLRWTSTNANSCTASGAWSGAKTTSGSYATGVLRQNTTYNLWCGGAGGSTNVSITVEVLPPTGPAPVVSFTADSVTIANGSGTMLRWSTTDATTCTADGAWTGSQATSGSFATGVLSADRYYTLYCEGPGGFSNYETLVINVFGAVNQQPNAWTLQQAVDSGFGLNCPSEMYEAGKGPNGINRYYFVDGKVRIQTEEFQPDGTLQTTYVNIFYPGVALYEVDGSTVPPVAYRTNYPGSLMYDYFASTMDTHTLTGYRCNAETIDPGLLTPIL